MQLDVGVIHHEVFGQKCPKLRRVYHVKFRVAFQTAQEISHSRFEVGPVLFEILNLQLCIGKLFIKAA